MTGQTGETIMLQAFPEFNSQKCDPESEADLEWVKQVVIGVRNIRGEMNISPGKSVPLLLHNGSDEDLRRLQENESFLKVMAKLESIEWKKPGDQLPPAATALVGQMDLLIPMAGLIDVDAEKARLNKEIEKLSKDKERFAAKLQNPNFVDKAPAAVVDKEKAKLAEVETALSKLQQQVKQLETL
jgi:valyl-tRNA synthetase